MRTLLRTRFKVCKGIDKSETASDSRHPPRCARIFLVVLVFCGSVLAVLISDDSDMIFVGRFLEPYWIMTFGRSSAKPSSEASHPVGPELSIHEAWSTLDQIKIATLNAPCHLALTHHVQVYGLPSPVDNEPVQLAVGLAHKLTILSYDIDGKSRCAGGDYFETDLSSGTWKSRPPVIDLANGSYHIWLQVDPQHTGLFILQIILTFRNFEGFIWTPMLTTLPTWRGEEVLKMEIEFILEGSNRSGRSAPHQAILQRCNASRGDFALQRWSGRWTRKDFRQECPVDADGRYRCLDLDTQCQSPWCEGPLGRLESNGWVYSAHCSFRIFTEEEAWTCLDGKWLLFWGDSNHQDSIRNLLSFVLGFPMFDTWMERRFDKIFNRTTNAPKPRKSNNQQQQSLRITNIFNGHHDENSDGEGLWALTNDDFRSLTERYFNMEELKTPDVVILNSGLHDALHWENALDYINIGVELAINFWQKLFEENVSRKQPLVIYRHTVATAGVQRTTVFNPSKVEWFTRILGERFAELKIKKFRIVDDFDITFPWHYDLRCSDGMHYGRPPSNEEWKDGVPGHQYFVDLMLVHIHLNVICP